MAIPGLRRSCFVGALLASAPLSAQWVDWQNQYPYTGHRVYAHTMHQTSDGNYLLCGSIHGAWTQGSGTPFEDWAIATYLVKIQPSGDTLWTQRIDSIKPGSITHVVDLIDGNTLIAGTAQSSYTYCGMGVSALPMAQLFALKIDQSDNTLWWHQYDQPCARTLADAWETANQEIHLLAMNTQQPNIQIGYTPPTWFEDYTLTSTGNTVSIEDQPMGTYYYDNIGCAALTSGRHVFSSVLDTVGQNNMELYLIRFTGDGDQGNMVLLSDTLRKNTRRIITTLDNGLLMLANYDYTSSRILRTDTNGTIVWDRIYNQKMMDVVALPDSTYLTVGTVGTFQSPDKQQLCVTLLSSAGDSLWSRLHGDSLYDMGSSVLLTPTGYVAYGTKDCFSGSVPPKLFIPADTLGFFTQIDHSNARASQLEIYPNPATEGINVRSPTDHVLRDDLLVLDPVGRIVRRIRVRSGSTQWIEVQDLSAGHYTLVATTDAGRSAAHFVVEH